MGREGRAMLEHGLSTYGMYLSDSYVATSLGLALQLPTFRYEVEHGISQEKKQLLTRLIDVVVENTYVPEARQVRRDDALCELDSILADYRIQIDASADVNIRNLEDASKRMSRFVNSYLDQAKGFLPDAEARSIRKAVNKGSMGPLMLELLAAREDPTDDFRFRLLSNARDAYASLMRSADYEGIKDLAYLFSAAGTDDKFGCEMSPGDSFYAQFSRMMTPKNAIVRFASAGLPKTVKDAGFARLYELASEPVGTKLRTESRIAKGALEDAYQMMLALNQVQPGIVDEYPALYQALFGLHEGKPALVSDTMGTELEDVLGIAYATLQSNGHAAGRPKGRFIQHMMNNHNPWRPSIGLLAALLLTACAGGVAAGTGGGGGNYGEPTAQPTLQPTQQPTAGYTQTAQPTLAPTSTPTPGSLSGMLFLDANGSGLRDNTIFLCPGSPRYVPESLGAFFPGACDGKGGQFVTVMEPVLPGFAVNATIGGNRYSAVTGPDGLYRITTVEPAGTQAQLQFIDPAQDPLRMGFINRFNGTVTIPPYSVGEYSVPEQVLNDTTLIEIANGISITVGQDQQIGLTQGFLTMPITSAQYPTLTQNQAYDHLLIPGKGVDFTGNPHICVTYNLCAPQAEWAPWQGTGDQHTGYDMGWVAEPKGDMGIASMPGEVYVVNEGSEFYIMSRLGWNFCDNNQPSDIYGAIYAHNMDALVRDGNILRGQLAVVIGNTGGTAHDSTHIHYDTRWGPVPEGIVDMNGDQACTKPMHRQMDPNYLIPGWNDKSLLTVDNLAQFVR